MEKFECKIIFKDNKSMKLEVTYLDQVYENIKKWNEDGKIPYTEDDIKQIIPLVGDNKEG